MWTKLVVPSMGSTMKVGAEVNLDVEVEDSSPKKLMVLAAKFYHPTVTWKGREFHTSNQGRPI